MKELYIRWELPPPSDIASGRIAEAFLNLENKKVERKNDQEKSKLDDHDIGKLG